MGSRKNKQTNKERKKKVVQDELQRLSLMSRHCRKKNRRARPMKVPRAPYCQPRCQETGNRQAVSQPVNAVCQGIFIRLDGVFPILGRKTHHYLVWNPLR